MGNLWSRELGMLLELLVDRTCEGHHTGDTARRLGSHFGRAGESFGRVLGEVDTTLMAHTGSSASEPVVRALALGWSDAFPLADDDIHRDPVTGLIDPATLLRRLDAVHRACPGADLHLIVVEVRDDVNLTADPLSPLREELTLTNVVDLVRPRLPTVLSWTRFAGSRAGAVIDPTCSPDQAAHDAEVVLAAVQRPWWVEVSTRPVPARLREVADLARELTR
ncbi:hypothetical protein [Aeromicrobium sp. CTD01-1L150]|uniref:hypothetical protein n=1 Tax=Aeromicrobium sp. CTD01-1L150 TaxID=3341830 RepID=UPI0035C0C61A